jgi:hypothetical protein
MRILGITVLTFYSLSPVEDTAVSWLGGRKAESFLSLSRWRERVGPAPLFFKDYERRPRTSAKNRECGVPRAGDVAQRQVRVDIIRIHFTDKNGRDDWI